MFHPGHVNLLRRCREISGPDGHVTVSLNTDEFIEQYKGKRPVCNFTERRDVLLSCKYVDEVVANIGGVNSKISVELCMPDYIVIGSDWAERDYYKQMGFDQKWLNEHNIGLVYVPYTPGVSSTDIKKRMS